jgi:hypothetical protein
MRGWHRGYLGAKAHWSRSFRSQRRCQRDRACCDNPLFYEEVDYAASRAFQRVTGDEHAFRDALVARGPRDLLTVMGEDFDFDDDQEMRRLPRLSVCCVGSMRPRSEQDGLVSGSVTSANADRPSGRYNW